MKVLHVSLTTAASPQTAQKNALKQLGTYQELDWMKHRTNTETIFYNMCTSMKPDLVFMQLQTGGVLSPAAIKKVKPFVGKIVNWTGDVRQPTPQWYLHMGRVCDLTLFTNDADIETLKAKGIPADYLQIGYDEKVYSKNGTNVNCPEIIFMGNNYGAMFPLSNQRSQMVNTMKKRFGDRFGIYGANWNHPAGDLNSDWMKEAAVYRSCKIAINFSHFNLSRYSSDRLFRIMGCGTFCLTHDYDNLDTEFYPGCHLDSWSSIDELVMKSQKYLTDIKNRQLIAQQGHTLVSNTCTWKHRIEQLKQIITRY